jgi:hypothetical protein
MPKCPDYSHLKRYRERSSPPRPANDGGCKGAYSVGNDGLPYRSVPNVNGVYRWVKVKPSTDPDQFYYVTLLADDKRVVVTTSKLTTHMAQVKRYIEDCMDIKMTSFKVASAASAYIMHIRSPDEWNDLWPDTGGEGECSFGSMKVAVYLDEISKGQAEEQLKPRVKRKTK